MLLFKIGLIYIQGTVRFLFSGLDPSTIQNVGIIITQLNNAETINYVLHILKYFDIKDSDFGVVVIIIETF